MLFSFVATGIIATFVTKFKFVAYNKGWSARVLNTGVEKVIRPNPTGDSLKLKLNLTLEIFLHKVLA